ncbi:sodium/pantothenate symporter [Tautonia sociabilis]|uniref:Sodium transporter n=1 Tax=Tautonia sociabilis TaxID=2080755 RepID=A0A432MM78_9BACT|nr:sodium transporter [Tautonia sociabilis]RUL88297.1 sodium transporter [Tautonia sociabilis]
MPELDAPSTGAPLVALVLFTMVSLGLGVVARWAERGAFLRRYFLGNRSLGPLSVALTAAVMSGGTFLGFPGFVYAFGWVVALWIASYMVAPLTVFGLLGKRIGQLSRRTGAITLPDLLRERFGSPALGVVTSLLIIAFLSVNLIPQFKGGAIILKTSLPTSWIASFSGMLPGPVEDPGYLLGLVIFATTVIAYTAYGGFLAAVWTDVFQSLVMAVGVMILLPLALVAAGGLSAATEAGIAQTDVNYAFGPGAGRAFHPIGLAVSFFFMWAITGIGQPSTLVRLMAFKDSRTLRYAILWVTLYNVVIYVPLILIFVAARGILPELEKPDEAMPALVRRLTNPYVSGLIMAAPYGAVMSTISGFLLVISSGLVRDVYQRFLRPRASEGEIATAGYAGTVGVGVLAALVATRPPDFLQLVIVFSSAGMASAFLIPAAMACFWRRGTAAGAMAAMVAGAATVIGLYAAGIIARNAFGYEPAVGPGSAIAPYYLLGLDPCVWGLGGSLLAGVVGSLLSPRPDPDRVSLLFDLQPRDAPAPASLELHPELSRPPMPPDPAVP